MSDFNYYSDSSEKKENTPEENSLFEAVCKGDEKYLLAANKNLNLNELFFVQRKYYYRSYLF